jgi:hypothetical protein
LGGDGWAAYGGYTYFHRSAPMYWPKDEVALIDTVAGFDALLYTQPPPPTLGFATLRCIGEVCVAHRPGGCRSISVTPIPIPDALIGTAAAKTTASLWHRKAAAMQCATDRWLLAGRDGRDIDAWRHRKMIAIVERHENPEVNRKLLPLGHQRVYENSDYEILLRLSLSPSPQ